jgi:hypothetical protein
MKCTSIKDSNIIKTTLLVQTKESFKVYESNKETKEEINYSEAECTKTAQVLFWDSYWDKLPEVILVDD